MDANTDQGQIIATDRGVHPQMDNIGQNQKLVFAMMLTTAMASMENIWRITGKLKKSKWNIFKMCH